MGGGFVNTLLQSASIQTTEGHQCAMHSIAGVLTPGCALDLVRVVFANSEWLVVGVDLRMAVVGIRPNRLIDILYGASFGSPDVPTATVLMVREDQRITLAGEARRAQERGLVLGLVTSQTEADLWLHRYRSVQQHWVAMMNRSRRAAEQQRTPIA